MYLIMYYDPNANRIEVEEYQTEVIATVEDVVFTTKDRVQEIRDAGAPTVKVFLVYAGIKMIEVIRK